MDITESPIRSPVDWPGLDGAADRRFRLLAVGDVRVEVRAVLPAGLRFTDITSDRLAYAPARAIVAGTAVNMARTAARYFRRVGVLARVGDDDYTPVIRRELRRLGLRGLLRVERGTPNGVTVMLRDRPSPDRGAARLLVADENAPSRRLSEHDVLAAAAGIRRADAVFLDGYALLSPVSRAALHRAAEIARRHGTLVAFDLVPHDIDARLPAADVVPLLERADVIISEAPTLARLLGLPAATTGSAETRGLLPVLDDLVGGRPLWLLRYGATSLEHVLAYRRGGPLLDYPTGFGENVQRTGFGDRLAAGELYWWLAARSGR